ncbi:hypothetical protein FHR99_003108 [Litorivivens lipolytica]|uniref:Uncharacterized protein n=1 Tax=Litorivivens lipolytica TaxID=1524264 RepID=A0A7W4W7G2_9GAMM|nr:hypothetical protein [Litorivivens lipolytica]MBB3048834.1 hypothetical protein [Litorivivens lipolytica]
MVITELGITPASSRRDLFLFQVDAYFLERRWRCDRDFCERWWGESLRHWFEFDRNHQPRAFIAGTMDMCINGTISIRHGRHRARWLLQLGLDKIPLYVDETSAGRLLRDGAGEPALEDYSLSLNRRLLPKGQPLIDVASFPASIEQPRRYATRR